MLRTQLLIFAMPIFAEVSPLKTGPCGRTIAVQVKEATMATRTRDRRFEFRTTDEERELIEQASATEGTTTSAFAVSSLVAAARHVLADRRDFVLSPVAITEWEALNDRPAHEVAGLLDLLRRPSPFDC
jgi:uncharacterized protein (DUF1778 family)